MWPYTGCLLLATSLLYGVLLPGAGRAQDTDTDQEWAALDRALGRPGRAQPDYVQKYSFSRGDLRVTAGEVTKKPALALGSRVAFRRTGGPSGRSRPPWASRQTRSKAAAR